MKSCPEEKHIIHLSQNWDEPLKQGLVGSRTEIGAKVGLSDGLEQLDQREPEQIEGLGLYFDGLGYFGEGFAPFNLGLDLVARERGQVFEQQL